MGVVKNISGDHTLKVEEGKVIIRIDPRYFRPTEVETLIGDASKAKNDLGWKPEITAQELCKEMVAEDYKAAQRFALLKTNNLEQPFTNEN